MLLPHVISASREDGPADMNQADPTSSSKAGSMSKRALLRSLFEEGSRKKKKKKGQSTTLIFNKKGKSTRGLPRATTKATRAAVGFQGLLLPLHV